MVTVLSQQPNPWAQALTNVGQIAMQTGQEVAQQRQDIGLAKYREGLITLQEGQQRLQRMRLAADEQQASVHAWNNLMNITSPKLRGSFFDANADILAPNAPKGSDDFKLMRDTLTSEPDFEAMKNGPFGEALAGMGLTPPQFMQLSQSAQGQVLGMIRDQQAATRTVEAEATQQHLVPGVPGFTYSQRGGFQQPAGGRAVAQAAERQGGDGITTRESQSVVTMPNGDQYPLLLQTDRSGRARYVNAVTGEVVNPAGATLQLPNGGTYTFPPEAAAGATGGTPQLSPAASQGGSGQPFVPAPDQTPPPMPNASPEASDEGTADRRRGASGNWGPAAAPATPTTAPAQQGMRIGRPEKELTESEAKNTGYHRRMTLGNRSIEDFFHENPDYLDSSVATLDSIARTIGEHGGKIAGGVGGAAGAVVGSIVPGVGTGAGAAAGGGIAYALGETFAPVLERWLTSDEGKLYSAAAAPFVTAALRKDSGANITSEEWRLAYREWLPLPGEPAEVVRQKMLNRQEAIEGARIGAGRGTNR